MKRLRLERLGHRDEFRFALHGVVDAAGARAVDQLLLQCLARDAQEVRLDLGGVTEFSAQGLSALQRHAKAFEGTSRRIVVEGAHGAVAETLVNSGAQIYIANAPGAERPEAEPAAPGPAGAAGSAGEAGTAARAVAPSRQLRRKIVEFRNLFEITQGLNLARDLDAVLNLFGLSVMGQFGVDRLALFLTDPDRDGALFPRQVRGFTQGHFQDFSLPMESARAILGDQTFVSVEAVVDAGARAADAPGPLAGDASGPLVGDAPPADPSAPVLTLRRTGLEWGVALWVRRDLIGILFVGGRGCRKGFQEDERDLLTILAHQAAVAIANARYHRQLEDRNLGLVRGMMALIESRDVYARGSTERVVRFVMAMARVLQVPQDETKYFIYGAVLRDIGMLAVSHLVLKNPAHLSEEEWSLIKQHPVRGAQILEEMNLSRGIVDVVLNHHERWGGEGYPFGIQGQEIPLGARIVSLVDAYVAMTSERPYRRALPIEKARQVISENWGSPFDPALVETFLTVLDRMERRSRLRLLDRHPTRPEQAGDHERAALDPLSSGATIPTPARDSDRGASASDPPPGPAASGASEPASATRSPDRRPVSMESHP